MFATCTTGAEICSDVEHGPHSLHVLVEGGYVILQGILRKQQRFKQQDIRR